jgi:hypothetical protein
VRRDDVLWRVAGEAVVLLRPDGGDADPLTVTRPGGAVWTALTEARSVEELTAAMAEQYEGDHDRIRSDLRALLAELEARRFVRRTA